MTLRDILNPWGALREARAEIGRLREQIESNTRSIDFLADRLLETTAEFHALSFASEEAWGRVIGSSAHAFFVKTFRAELERLKRAYKRDAKTGRFVV